MFSIRYAACVQCRVLTTVSLLHPVTIVALLMAPVFFHGNLADMRPLVCSLKPEEATCQFQVKQTPPVLDIFTSAQSHVHLGKLKSLMLHRFHRQCRATLLVFGSPSRLARFFSPLSAVHHQASSSALLLVSFSEPLERVVVWTFSKPRSRPSRVWIAAVSGVSLHKP